MYEGLMSWNLLDIWRKSVITIPKQINKNKQYYIITSSTQDYLEIYFWARGINADICLKCYAYSSYDALGNRHTLNICLKDCTSTFLPLFLLLDAEHTLKGEQRSNEHYERSLRPCWSSSLEVAKNINELYKKIIIVYTSDAMMLSNNGCWTQVWTPRDSRNLMRKTLLLYKVKNKNLMFLQTSFQFIM